MSLIAKRQSLSDIYFYRSTILLPETFCITEEASSLNKFCNRTTRNKYLELAMKNELHYLPLETTEKLLEIHIQ